MRFSHWILIAVLALVLSVSIVLGQIVYRLDTTVISYRYMTEAVPRLVEPLDDPEIHRQTVDSLSAVVRDVGNMDLPAQLIPLFEDAAVAAFDQSWFEWTLTRNMYSIIGVLRGSRNELRLPVNISGFESAFITEVRRSLPPEYVQQVVAEAANLPGAFDLATAIPEATRASLVRFGGRYGLLSTVVTYIIPGLLTIGCFSFRRVGTAFLGGGLGYLAGGGAVLIWGSALGRAASNTVVATARTSFPRGLSWLTAELVALINDIAGGLRQYALLIAIAGLIAGGLGAWMVFTGRNETLDFAALSTSDDEQE